MVTATLVPPRGAGGSGTPIKRPIHPSASFPSTKKQRSYDDDISGTVKSGFVDDQDGGGGGLTIPAQMIKLDQSEIRLNSPSGILKSNLKAASPICSSSLSSNILDSPSEIDKRGMYSEFVQAALDDRSRGKDGSYQELVSQFRPPSQKSMSSIPSITLLQTLLHSLSNVASRLDRRNHTPLVDNILTLPWATMGGYSFARTWMRFVCTLCSVRSEWVGEVLSRAVKGLSYRSDWRSLAYMPPGTSSSRPTRRAIYSRIHTLLRSLLSLIPTLPTQLAPLVLRHFPHKREGIKEHVVYIRNVFELCDYAEELRPGVLECVLGRAVEIDVEIQIELDELEEAEAEMEEVGETIDVGKKQGDVEGDLFDRPIDDEEEDDSDLENEEDGAWEEGIQSDDDLEEKKMAEDNKSEQKRTTQIRLLVDKLDAIMETMFQQLETTDTRFLRICKGLDLVDSVLTPARAISLRNDQFTDLLRIFTKTLLPTFKSRHVQFVLFWFASLDVDFGDLFLGLLLSKAIYSAPSKGENEFSTKEEEVPMIMRVASASYVASLVSRAKYINGADARTVMLNLCAFLEAHLDAYGNGWLTNDSHMQRMDDNTVVGPHSLFYAVCQACFYIFCFRWRELRLTNEEDEEEEEANSESELEEALGVQSSRSISKWCEGMESIKRAIMSNLNPLANCSPVVAEQFAGVAQLTGFLYCWSLIEKNSRSAAPSKISSKHNSAATTSMTDSQSNETLLASPVKEPGQQKQAVSQATTVATRKELDSFFPFDPYRLRCSTKWVEPLYREWSDVAPQEMLDEEDDEEDEEEEEEEEDDGDATESDDSSDVSPSRNALKIPKARRSTARDGFAPSSTSTDEDCVAQSLNSLEAMSISPFGPR